MNPLLDDAQREHVAEARNAVEQHLAAVAEAIEAEGGCPTEVLAAVTTGRMLGGTGDDRLLRLALTAEQVARKSAAVAALVATQGVAAMIHAATAARRVALIVEGVKATAIQGGGYHLDGQAPLVIGAADAEAFLVFAALADGQGVWVVRPGDSGTHVDEADDLLGINGAGVAAVQFAATRVADDARLGDAAASAPVRDWMHVALSAVAVGVARGALDAAVSDVLARREAGDRADRSQVLQWMLADIATEAEAARVATWFAATQPVGPGLAEAAAMCRVLAADAAVSATRRAVQVLGERGLLRASGVERLYRDAKVLEVLGGSSEACLARIAAYRLPDLVGA